MKSLKNVHIYYILPLFFFKKSYLKNHSWNCAGGYVRNNTNKLLIFSEKYILFASPIKSISPGILSTKHVKLWHG